MEKFKIFIVICVFILAIFLPPQASVSAQGQYSVDVPLEALHAEQPISLNGLFSSQTLNIPIPDSWLLNEGNWIEINIRASELLDLDRSSLNISLNGLTVRSFQVSAVAGTGQSVSLPADMFSLGNNTLTFTGMLYLPQDLVSNCQNWDDPSRWLAIDPGGKLHLSFSKREFPVDLSVFPQSFIEPLERYLPQTDKTQTLFVLPDNSKKDDLTSLVTIAYILGSEAGSGYYWNPEIVTESQFDARTTSDRNIIFINNTPTEWKGVTDADKNSLLVAPSPWGKGKTALVLGDENREDGFSPATAFSVPSRKVLLRGNIAYLDPAPLPVARPFQGDVSFKDLGYLDRTVRGIGKQDLIYRLFIPYNVDPTTATLFLSLTHSPDLDTRSSSFLIFLNGFSIAGILPNANSANPAPIKIGLPATRFRPGINFIRISFDLHTSYSSCERAPESVWATVFNTSTFEIRYQDRTSLPSLEYFPLPFSDYPGFTYVIPDSYALKDLAHIARLSFAVGQFAYFPDLPPDVMTVANFNSTKPARPNIMIVGLPGQNSALMSINALLPQPFTADGKALQEGYGVFLPTSDKDASLGLMQIISSPWTKEGDILVLTGNDAQGLEWTWEKLEDPASWTQFAGNLMLVGSGKRIAVPSASEPGLQVNFQQTADVSNIPIIGPILQKAGQLAPIPALIAIGASLTMLLAILTAIQIMRKRRIALNTSLAELGGEEHER